MKMKNNKFITKEMILKTITSSESFNEYENIKNNFSEILDKYKSELNVLKQNLNNLLEEKNILLNDIQKAKDIDDQELYVSKREELNKILLSIEFTQSKIDKLENNKLINYEEYISNKYNIIGISNHLNVLFNNMLKNIISEFDNAKQELNVISNELNDLLSINRNSLFKIKYKEKDPKGYVISMNEDSLDTPIGESISRIKELMNSIK